MAVADFTNTPIEKLISLEGRTAVVTGGARGIGFAIARRLAQAGANIVIADIDVGDCLDESVEELKKEGTEVIGLKQDTRERKAMENVASKAIEHFGSLDIWVNDAGIYPAAAIDELSDDTWEDVIGTNITGVHNGILAAFPHMKKKGGVILNLASVSGYSGEEEMAHYNATKFAVRGLTAGYAKELGEHGIRVVAIAPTLVDTPGVHEEVPNLKKEMKETAKEIPLGRVSVPDDIARMSLVLASDLAAYVSGTTFVVDGGNMSLG